MLVITKKKVVKVLKEVNYNQLFSFPISSRDLKELGNKFAGTFQNLCLH